MSCPAASLKKSRRAPFRSDAGRRFEATRDVDTRTPTSVAELDAAGSFGDDAELRSLADDVLNADVAKKIGRERQQQQKQQQKQQQQQQQQLPPLRRPRSRGNSATSSSSSSSVAVAGGGVSDAELLVAAMSKVASLESRCREQQEELRRRQRRVDALEEKLRLLTPRVGNGEGEGDGEESRRRLRDTCARLQRQVYDMENFLADYGLVWVGEGEGDGEGEGEGEELWRPGDSVASWPDARQVAAGLRRLNEVCVDSVGELLVTATPSGAKLAPQSPVPARIFADGLLLWEGPFRSFAEASTRQFAADVLDGYFPSELQSRFPDGVPFAVDDRSGETFAEAEASSFAGAGRRLGSGVRRLLRRLPASVVAASGEVVDVRQSVAERLGEGDASATTSGGVVVRLDSPSASASASATGFALVKVRAHFNKSTEAHSNKSTEAESGKSAEGRTTYILRLLASEPIGEVYRLLRSQPPLAGAEFSLATAYPRQLLLESDAASLRERGLAPSSSSSSSSSSRQLPPSAVQMSMSVAPMPMVQLGNRGGGQQQQQQQQQKPPSEGVPRQTRQMRVGLLPSRFPATFATLVFELEQDAKWKQLLRHTRPYEPEPDRPRDPRAKELHCVSSAAELLYIWRSRASVGDLVDALEQCQLQDIADSLLQNLMPEDEEFGCNFLRFGSPSDRAGSPTGGGGKSGHSASESRIRIPQELQCSAKRCDWHDAMLAVSQGRVLGRGGYGNIYKAQWGDRDVAIKFFENLEKKVMHELEASTVRMCKVYHPNLVMLLGFAEPDSAKVDSLVHILEFAVHGDLRRQLDLFEDARAQLPEFNQYITRLTIAIQVAGAIEYLHSCTETALTISNKQSKFYFVHKDVKSANILLTEGWQCKLSDLDFLDVSTIGDGTTSLMDQRQRSPTIFGTDGFFPPADNRLTCAWDVYSFGVTLLEIFTGRPAVDPDSKMPTQQRLLANCLDDCNTETFAECGVSPQPGLEVDEGRFRDLCLLVVRPMLSKNKNLRPYMSRVRQQLEGLFEEVA